LGVLPPTSKFQAISSTSHNKGDSMKIARRILVVGLVLAVSVTMFSVFNPRAAQAVISTFVQVTNDAAHAVPVVEPPTALVFSGPVSGAVPTPLDVSAYRKIRVSFDTASEIGGRVIVLNVDGPVPITLAEIVSSTPSASEVIDVPGRMISLEDYRADGTTLNNVVVDGR
jgi:hypothetical protein